MNLSVTLPWPPANVNTNSQWRISGKRIHQRPEATGYKNEVAVLVRQALWKSFQLVPQCPLSISLRQYPPDKRRRDVDGCVKVVLDAVAVGLGIDDVQFRILTARMDDPPDKASPRIDVVVSDKAG